MVVKKCEVEGIGGVIGGFGRYQVWQYCLAMLPVVFTAMSQTNFVFAAAAVQYRCAVPACESSHPSVTSPAWWPPSIADHRCTRPLLAARDVTNCTAEAFSNLTESCQRWVYGDGNSIVSEFDLACQEWKRTLVGTVHNVGVLISMPIMGYISDRWGRRTAIILSSVGLMSGALKTLAGGPAAYVIYLVLEMLEAAIVSGTYTTAFVLMLELVGKDKRIISSFALGINIALGDLCLALAVWLVPYWRQFQLLIYCPAVIFLSYIFLLEESLRWLVINGKEERVKTLMEKIARWNGLTLTEKAVEAVQEVEGVNQEMETEKFSVKLLFSSRVLLKRLLVCSWWWFSAAFVYYGLVINSVALPGDKVTNFALSSLATVPGDLVALVALQKIGRQKTLLGGFLCCGVFCVASGFIPEDQKVAKIAVYLAGKSSIALCFNTVYVYTSELVPTSARGSLLGACSMVARIGSVLAPVTPLLSTWWAPLPTVMFGCCALCAGALTLGAPETLRRDLPDTVAQATTIT